MVQGQVTRDSQSLETPEVDLIHVTSSPRQTDSKSAQGLALISEGESLATRNFQYALGTSPFSPSLAISKVMKSDNSIV